MHPFVLIPLLTLVVSCVVGSASVARDRAFRPNRVVAAVMLCTGAWATLEIAYTLQTDAAAALRIVRLLGLAYLPLAPLVLELIYNLGQLDEETWPRLRRPVWIGVGLVGLAHATTPWFVDSVTPTPYGWRYAFGPAFWPGLLATVAGCAGGALRLMGRGNLEPAVERRLHVLGSIIWFPILVTCLTDVLLPALAIDGPRLGAASIVLSAGLLWVGLFSAGAPDLASSALARQFLDQLPDGVAILRRDGVLRSANQRLSGILQCDREQLVGRPVEDWLGGPRPRPLGQVHELRIEAPSGALPIALWESEVRDRQGQPIGSVLVVRDQRALVDLRRQLVTSGQMSALGELAAGIAHEVNNPIAYVLANLNQLRRELAEVTKEREAAAALAGGPDRIDACTRQLGRVVDFVAEVRQFAHQGSTRPAPHAINELVEGALRLAAPRLRDRHVLHFEPGDLPALRCAAQELKHALLCLLMALDEIAPGGEIRLRTRPTQDGVDIDLETAAPLRQPALLDRQELLLAGAPAGGLGLLIPRHLLRQQGGRLSVESLHRGGSRLRVSLPAAEAAR